MLLEPVHDNYGWPEKKGRKICENTCRKRKVVQRQFISQVKNKLLWCPLIFNFPPLSLQYFGIDKEARFKLWDIEEVTTMLFSSNLLCYNDGSEEEKDDDSMQKWKRGRNSNASKTTFLYSRQRKIFRFADACL